MPVDLAERRSNLLWKIDLLLESLADTYYADEEEEQRELLKQIGELFNTLEKGRK
jgi:hypothetical protein